MRLVGKNVVIYGGGLSGRSAYELVRDKGAKAIIYDDNPLTPRTTNSRLIFDEADIIVLSPGVDCKKEMLLEAKLNNKLVIGELELSSHCCDAKQIAITGTNGKTTTTLLVNHILTRAGFHSHAVGNIGAPFSAIADRLDESEYAVIEASSFQLESAINFSPDVAVLLNITPDHISRHQTIDRYIDAKSNVFLHQAEQDIIIYNDDDPLIAQLVPKMVAKKVPFSINHPTCGAYISSSFVCYKGKPIIALDDIDFCGKELENVLAAVSVCALQGVSNYCIASALVDFSRPKFRRERVGIIDGIAIFDDSKSTNISSCLCAISAVGNTMLILGGQKGSEDFNTLFDALPSNVKGIYASGENSNEIKECAMRYGIDVGVYDDIKDCLVASYNDAKKKGVDNILLSPASKSFDKFNSFEERGKYFNSCVTQLRITK